MSKNYCGGHLLRCAVLAPSPIYLICFGRCAPCALQLAFLATFFNSLLMGNHNKNVHFTGKLIYNYHLSKACWQNPVTFNQENALDHS